MNRIVPGSAFAPALPKVVVAQVGAREHYAVPEMLHAHGMLARLYTDIYWKAPFGPSALPSFVPKGLRRLAGRRSAVLPDRLVRSFDAALMADRLRQLYATRPTRLGDRLLDYDRRFTRRVLARLADEDHDAVLGFSGGALELLEHARRTGRTGILDVIAPPFEDEIVAAEDARFPALRGLTDAGLTPETLARHAEEWALADVLVVNSDWTRRQLLRAGVDEARIRVVPVVYRPPGDAAPRPPADGRPLRVLWVGSLNLRKGFPYALDAARRLARSGITFTFAGPAEIATDAVDWPANARWLGQVPRAEVAALFRTHDLFLLPTLSDGFAITQLEAMAHGLPVIATEHCGAVVEPGVSGLLVPTRSGEAIAEAVGRFASGSIRLDDASAAALRRAGDFTREAVAPALVAAVRAATEAPA
jgi:glycosyltransferase involved in cell wall biosynthesis